MSVCVLGSLNLDIVCRVAELPRPGETVVGLGVTRAPGGKGANQAVAAARTGTETILIGAVGREKAGAFMLAAMKDAGVDTRHVAEVARRPGIPPLVSSRPEGRPSGPQSRDLLITGGAK